MNYIKTLFLFLFVCINVYPQDFEDKEQEQYLKSYIKFGFGKMNDYINFGGGLFFTVSPKILLGARANVNSEVIIFKTPAESLFDLNLSIRYVPLIWNNLVLQAGAGIGYAGGVKRGALLSKPLLITEEYEKDSFGSVSALAEIEAGFFITKFLGVSAAAYSVFTSKKNIYTYQVGLFIYGLNNP